MSNSEASLRKGTLVKPVRDGVYAWRRCTDEEKRVWYDHFHAECRAGRDVPFDSAGEPQLAPLDKTFRINSSTVLTVVRARVAAPEGYGTRKGCCQVFDPSSGETLYVLRRSLTSSW
jgi:hypothetical protein